MLDLSKLRDLDAISLSLARPEDILSWSFGEVTKPETINYRSLKPEKNGLFCEVIFGPTKDYECYCGKYKRIRYKGVKCDRCGVQVTSSKVRRERMGHINLACPVAHVWFFKNVPSKLATVLGISPRSLEMVIYFSSFIVTKIDYDKKKEVLGEFKKFIEEKRKETRSNLEAQADTILKEAQENAKALRAENEEENRKGKRADTKIDNILKKAKDKADQIKSTIDVEVEKVELVIRKSEKKLAEVELYSVIGDAEYIELEDYLDRFCNVGIGAESILDILKDVDLTKLSVDLKEEMGHTKSIKYKKLIKRVKLRRVNKRWG